jgi:hypothetical protein
METTPATEMGIEPLVERVARAMAADQSKRLYGIDRGQDEAWEANTDYGRTELLADARAAIAAYEATRTPEAAQVESLFSAIAHGDDEHRVWLKEAIDAHFAGDPVPPCRGKGRKEAQVEMLREALDTAAGAIEGAVGVYDQSIPLNTCEEFAGVPIAAIRRLVAVAKYARSALAQVRHPSGEQSS